MSSSYNNSIPSSSTRFFILSGAGTGVNNFNHKEPTMMTIQQPKSVAPPPKKQINQSENPNRDVEVIALSPETIMATNRFKCEVCNKGFKREQNLQFHRRVHNLQWKLKQKSNEEVKRKVYVCPEPTCVHHDSSRALGDLTGIKKHYYRKHGEKNWECEKCSKRYAIQSDLKAHSKTCSTKGYPCDCGATFYRRDAYITHKEICDAIIQELAINPTVSPTAMASSSVLSHNHFGNNPNSGFTPLAAGYNPNLFNLGYFQYIAKGPDQTGVPSLFPNGAVNNDPCAALLRGLSSSSASSVVVNDFGIFQGLMNSVAATTDHQGQSSIHFGNSLSMGGSDRLTSDFLGVNGNFVSNANGRGGRNHPIWKSLS